MSLRHLSIVFRQVSRVCFHMTRRNVFVFRPRRLDRHVLSHDAFLQLRRASHVRPQPKDLLPVRLPAYVRWACVVSLARCASANHQRQHSNKVTTFMILYSCIHVHVDPKFPPFYLVCCFAEWKLFWINTGRRRRCTTLTSFLFHSVTTSVTTTATSGTDSSKTTKSCSTS